MKKKAAKEIYTLADLKNWNEAVVPPIRLGVLGDPVKHSLSPQIQNAAFNEYKINMQYARFEISAPQLRDAFDIIRGLDFAGLNLTIPHKIAAIDLLDEIDEIASEAGAVNTIKIENEKFLGFNTDGEGFGRAVREEFSVDLRDLRIMVLGAGGAARAIALHCAREKCERLVIVNRDVEKAKKLAATLRQYFAEPKVFGPVARLQALPLDERAIESQIGNLDLIVNATPQGLNRRDPPPISSRLLVPHLMVFDTNYSADGHTRLVIAALEAGARAADGLSMLLHQGALAFEIWFDRPAPLDAMRQSLK